MSKPKTLDDLRNFYCDEYRPLYDIFVVAHHLPQELHAEVAAAFDHLMRNPLNSDGSFKMEDFNRVVGHLKRATFDSFKLLFEEIRKKHDRLMNECYRNVEDGEFQPRINKLYNEASRIAIAARTAEHITDEADTEAWDNAFETWRKIIPILEQLTAEEESDKVSRAKRNLALERVKWWVSSIFVGVIGTLIVEFIMFIVRVSAKN